jgi:hypothetical protein
MDRIFADGQEARPSRLGPWPKACPGCAMRNNDPQGIGSDAQRDVRNLVRCGSLTFFCLHRTMTAGRHRECACAAAIARKPSTSASTQTRP